MTNNNKPKHNYLYYGTKTTASEVQRFLEHAIKTNALAEANNKKKISNLYLGKTRNR